MNYFFQVRKKSVETEQQQNKRLNCVPFFTTRSELWKCWNETERKWRKWMWYTQIAVDTTHTALWRFSQGISSVLKLCLKMCQGCSTFTLSMTFTLFLDNLGSLWLSVGLLCKNYLLFRVPIAVWIIWRS